MREKIVKSFPSIWLSAVENAARCLLKAKPESCLRLSPGQAGIGQGDENRFLPTRYRSFREYATLLSKHGIELAFSPLITETLGPNDRRKHS